MQQLPIIMQDTPTASPLDAEQFVTIPVLAIRDALPVVRGGLSVFVIELLDSPGPVSVRIVAISGSNTGAAPVELDPSDIPIVIDNYKTFDQIIVVNGKTLVSIPTTGGPADPPDPEYFSVQLQAIDPCYIVRANAVGQIGETVTFATYDIGVYEADPVQTYQ